MAGIFSTIGDTGLLLTEQVFIAETTTLLNRGLLAALPEATTGIMAIYLGSIIANDLLAKSDSNWRWGYGMWAIILPVCACPLVLTIFILQRKAARAGKLERVEAVPRSVGQKKSKIRTLSQFLCLELDLVGAILLVVGFALLLIPISLTGS